MRISDHFDEALKTHEKSLSKKERESRALDALRALGIPPTRYRNYPHEFSGGMRQRIMIALALALRPKFIIADEPTTALDVLVEAQILRILADIREQYSPAILLITHNLGHRRRGVRPTWRSCTPGASSSRARCARSSPTPQAPVHAGAAALDDLAQDAGAAFDPGRAAGSRRAAARLPVPPALRARDADLRRRKPPPRFGPSTARECWLLEPSLTDADRAPLDRQEVSVADEA